ncbi:MAG: hypothetical protein JNM68_01840 [Dinghuibacter sp.]|nr:hypothetical protein [Dinghuibacter sp.]
MMYKSFMIPAAIFISGIFQQSFARAHSGDSVTRNTATVTASSSMGTTGLFTQYSFSRVFTDTLLNIFELPANVKELVIEQWGGGGGGGYAGGGAAGTYCRYRINTTNVMRLEIKNGAGGLFSSSNSQAGQTNGGKSRVLVVKKSSAPIAFNTPGGDGAAHSGAGLGNDIPAADLSLITNNTLSFFFVPGNSGGNTRLGGSVQVTGNNFFFYHGGNGGTPYGLQGEGSHGGSWLDQMNGSSANIVISSPPVITKTACGGAAGRFFSNNQFFGAMGGNGLTIVWWNVETTTTPIL